MVLTPPNDLFMFTGMPRPKAYPTQNMRANQSHPCVHLKIDTADLDAILSEPQIQNKNQELSQ